MLGAFFILDDPIFNGLAVSLIFGILVSTVLTLVVIPILYYSYLRRRPTVPAPEPTPAAPSVALGTLVITSAPQNCVVEIDGRPHTKTSPVLTVGGLGAGEHTVVFRKPGYEPLRRTISIPPGATLAVHGNLKQRTVDVEHPGVGSLRLRCRPTSCTVRLLGMLRDTSGGSLKLSHLPAGEHRLVVAIPGRELQTSILILDGQRTEVEASFLKGEEPFRVTHVPR
jgi:hypothetical protein